MRFQEAELAIPDVDMTPMIDIVFQLMTFFMLVTNFENLKADERVKLPNNDRAKPPQVAREKELVLNVGFDRNPDGSKIDPEAKLFYAGDSMPVLNSASALNREKRLYRDLGIDPKDITVVIRSDAEVPTGDIQELIKLCQESTNDIGGFQKFALKAKAEESE